MLIKTQKISKIKTPPPPAFTAAPIPTQNRWDVLSTLASKLNKNEDQNSTASSKSTEDQPQFQKSNNNESKTNEVQKTKENKNKSKTVNKQQPQASTKDSTIYDAQQPITEQKNKDSSFSETF